MDIGICDSCYIRFDLIDASEQCPILGCDGETIVIDDLMMDTIEVLWRKGYETQYCCSGHITEVSFHCYIRFVSKTVFGDSPHGFTYVPGESQLYCSVSEDQWSAMNYLDRMNRLCEANTELYNWANKLKEA